MDLICCSCVEWKSDAKCKPIEKLPTEKIVQYLIENDLMRNSGGRNCVCLTCKASIDRNIEPTRPQKEILGFLSFPEELKKVLEIKCTPRRKNERRDPTLD